MEDENHSLGLNRLKSKQIWKNVADVVGTLYANSIVLHTFSFKFCNFAKMQAFLFVAGGETCQTIRGTPLRLAQTYILVNARG